MYLISDDVQFIQFFESMDSKGCNQIDMNPDVQDLLFENKNSADNFDWLKCILSDFLLISKCKLIPYEMSQKLRKTFKFKIQESVKRFILFC